MRRPDVLCIQETKVQDAEFPGDAFERAGYHCAFRGQKAYNGVAILSRRTPADVSFGLDSKPADESRLVRVSISGVNIINTYVPQGRAPDSEFFQYKLDWFARLKRYFAAHFNSNDPLVWVGDLNIAPEPRDVHSPDTLLGHVCFHPEVHDALTNIMQWGLVDVFRQHCDEPGRYTYWDYRVRNAVRSNRGWRLDHVMATAPLAQKCTDCVIDTEPRLWERPSDHTPVVATFTL